MYEIDQDYINFLRGEGRFAYRLKNEVDKQVYSHYGFEKDNTDKYIGVIINFNDIKMFAPITHDGNRNWFNRDDTCDIEKIYNRRNEYTGALLLCKAIAIPKKSYKEFMFNSIYYKNNKYLILCDNEIKFLNRNDVYDKVQNKLLMCIDKQPSSVMKYRVDYELTWVNSIKYQKLIELEKEVNRSR